MEKSRRLLQTVGIETFIKYYLDFEKSKNSSDNEYLIDLFHKNNENWKDSSCATKASNGKAIFKKGLEKEALEYIVKESRNVPINIVRKASEFYFSL